ncbi:MAG: hypothetical protein EOP84_01565 [Verrucomicrobiaceae bacterium]|nr:MAG: hypothetical protein EOP84_01565 [Verrucomicrobiaceae bacterium]
MAEPETESEGDVPEGEYSDIAELLEGMRPPAVPDEALTLSPELLEAVRSWKRTSAVATIAGLLIDPSLQANTIRLDWLQRLVIAHANGSLKPKRRDLLHALNAGMETARVARLEDPIEDCFVEAIPTSRGDFLIFDGNWEHAAPYTETVVRAFELLPDASAKDRALDCAYSLLAISDAVAKRAQLQRRAYVGGTPAGEMALPSNEQMQLLSRRVKFTDAQLEKLGISKELLTPFYLLPEHFESVGASVVGDSPLEFYPLLLTEGGLIVISPGSLSLAVRACLLDTAKRGGMSNAFLSRLATVQEDFAVSSLFWPGSQLRLSRPDKHMLRASVCHFAPGRYMHVIQVMSTLENFPDIAFGETTRLPDGTDQKIADDVAKFWEFLKGQADYRESITVLLLSGWGTGLAFAPPIDRTSMPEGWRFLPLTFGDAALLGGCEGGKLRHLWRVVEQVEILERAGYAVMNINGTVNMFGNWRETQGNFIPEHLVDITPPTMISLPLDDLLKPRIESLTNRDARTLPFVDGAFKLVQRMEWGQDGPLAPIYVSLDDVADHRMLGAVQLADAIWWIEAEQADTAPARIDWQYQVWRALLKWIAEVAKTAVHALTPNTPVRNAYVRVILMDDKLFERGGAAPLTGDPSAFIAVERDGGHPAIRIQPGWGAYLRQTEHVAEFALCRTVLRELAAAHGVEISAEQADQYIKHAILSTDWRWLHAHEAKTPIERLAASGLVQGFHEIPMSARALVRCGCVWHFWDRSNGNELIGEERCKDFLASYSEFILSEIIARIRKFDRQKLVVASARRYQSGRRELASWRTSIRALRAIRGADADLSAFERQNDINAVQRAAKAICEIGACEAPLTGGADVGRDDLDELYAFALLLFGNGQLFSTIRAGLVPAHLKISPAGDLLSDRSVFEKTFVPSSVRANKKVLDEASTSYSSRNEAKEPPEERLTWTQEMRDAVEAEFGCTSEGFVDLQFALVQLAEVKRADVLVMHRSELIQTLNENEDYPQQDLNGLLDRITLKRRDNWKAKPSGYAQRDLELWRFDRAHSTISQPLIAISDGDDPLLVIAPILVSDSAFYAVGGLHYGSIHNEFWRSAAAKAYAGSRSDALGMEFENKVCATLNAAGFNATPRRTLPDLLRRGMETDFGDVDVFAISPDGKTLWVLEAKNLRLCRTEVEVAARMTEYRGKSRTDDKGKERPDKLLKHLRRVSHLRDNADRLRETLKLSCIPTVRGLVVVDAPQPMNFSKREELPDGHTYMLDDLLDHLENQDG